MEDFQLDLMIGEGPAARSVQDRPAAVHAGRRDHPRRPAHHAAARPLRHPDPARLLHASTSWSRSCARGARVLGIGMTEDGAHEIARRSRGTPRIAGRLLRRVRDFAIVDGRRRDRRARSPTARCAALEVDAVGLDAMDRRYLTTDRRSLRRRPGRHRDHRRGAVRAARRHRGHHRAVPDPAGLHPAHAARPRADPARLPPSRPAGAAARSGGSSGCSERRRRGGRLAPVSALSPSFWVVWPSGSRAGGAAGERASGDPWIPIGRWA